MRTRLDQMGTAADTEEEAAGGAEQVGVGDSENGAEGAGGKAGGADAEEREVGRGSGVEGKAWSRALRPRSAESDRVLKLLGIASS